MSQGLFSIGGLGSGLDTNNIVDQLLKLERIPITRIEAQKQSLTVVKEAWGQINTKLSSLRASVDKINRIDRFDRFMSLSSSDTDAVSVTSSGTTQTGSLSFTVEQLATSMQRGSTDVFASRDAGLGGRELSITDADGEAHAFTSATLGADATLADLVAAVNDADIGVRAMALQVAPGEFRLVLAATDTGEANAFEATGTGTGWGDGGAFGVTQAAANARLRVGGIDGIIIARSSNTISDLVEGATLTLEKTTATPVTVTAARDVDGAVAAVQAFTAALNGVMGTLKQFTSYDPEAKKAGILQGQRGASQLATVLRNAVSRPVPGLSGIGSLASTLGIVVNRDGTFDFDEVKVRDAFTTDFAGTAARLVGSGTTTDAAGSYVGATSASTPGTYEVTVSRAAEAAVASTGASYLPITTTEPKIMQISRAGGDPVRITIPEGSTSAEIVALVNTALQAASVSGITASETDGGGLQIAESRYGSAASFTVEELTAEIDGEVVVGGTLWGLEGTHTGVDVQGRIGGPDTALLTGTGRTLTGTDGGAAGVSVQVDGQPDPFDVTWSRGIIGELGEALAAAEGTNGVVSRARSSMDDQVAIYQTRIDGFEQRLITREATIRRQFVGMETLLAKFNAQGEWLQQQISGLNAQMQANSRR